MKILKPMKLFTCRKRMLCIALLLFGFGFFANAQQVTGVVTGEDGQPLIGASVVLKGTNTGTITDLDGKYSISAKEGQELVFSIVGMESQTIKVGTSKTVNVVLGGSVMLESVVIEGALGIVQDKRKLSYSGQGIKSEEITNAKRDDAFQTLEGRIAGLTLTPTSGLVGGTTAIRLRGVSSIGSSNQPLIVVDGLPILSGVFNQHSLYSDAVGLNGNINNNRDETGSRLSDINPNDIESISVLKGPEAAALYGSEGANGVILITTKKGKSGTTRIEYSNKFTTSELYLFPEIQHLYNRGKDGVNKDNEAEYFGAKYADTTVFYDNLANFFQKGNLMRHDVAFEGGSEIFTYRLSGAYLNSVGNVPFNKFNQLNLTAANTVKFSSWLAGKSRFAFTQNANDIPVGGTQGFLLSTLRYPSNIDMRNYIDADGNRTLTSTALKYDTDNENAFFNVNKNINSVKTNRSSANMSLTATLASWWTVTGNWALDYYTTIGNRFYHGQSNVGYAKGGWIENYTDVNRLLNTTFFTTLKKKLGKLDGSLIIGTAAEDLRQELTTDYGEKLLLPEFNSINNTEPTTQRNRTTIGRKRVVGAFAKAELNINDYIIFNLTGRNDWVSTLPIANRSYFYPSAGVTFNFTDLPVLKGKSGILNFGKIRASYARVGLPAPIYKIKARLTSQTSTGGGFLYDFYGDNPDLKPEQTKSFEVGTELAFFNDRLTFDFSYYEKGMYDQIVNQRISYGTGFVFALVNGGDLNTKGIDFQVSINAIKRPNFEWNINTNFTKYETNVNNLPANVSEYYDSDTWVYSNVRASVFTTENILTERFNTPGSNLFYGGLNSLGAGSATAIGGWSYLRNSKGDILINPNTGFPFINQNFLPLGDRNPDFIIGLVNDFKLMKNLRLSFMLRIRKGGDIFNGNAFYLFQNGLYDKNLSHRFVGNPTFNRDSAIVFIGVVKDGKEESETPTVNTKKITPLNNELFFTTVIQPEDFIERDINWVRLSDVTLTYNLPKTILGKQNVIKKAEIFVNGTDLFLWTNYTGADPFVSATNPATGGAGGFGFDIGKTSMPRSFSVGLNVTF